MQLSNINMYTYVFDQYDIVIHDVLLMMYTFLIHTNEKCRYYI